jgi:putative PIN family toxin of toxin-antitoxin system
MPSHGQEKKSIKAVLDTNVLISAYLFRNKLGPIADLVQTDLIRPNFIVSTFTEFEEVLAYPKFAKVMQRQETNPEKSFATSFLASISNFI